MSVSSAVHNLVSDLLKDFIFYYPITCKVCQEEMISMTIQRLPANYISYFTDEFITKTLLLHSQFRVDITKELTRAAIELTRDKNPNHKCSEKDVYNGK